MVFVIVTYIKVNINQTKFSDFRSSHVSPQESGHHILLPRIKRYTYIHVIDTCRLILRTKQKQINIDNIVGWGYSSLMFIYVCVCTYEVWNCIFRDMKYYTIKPVIKF